MTKQLDDRVAIITGGSRGIGKEIAANIAAAGAKVVIVSRKADSCAQAAAEIGFGCEWMTANAGSADDADRVVSEVVDRHGRVDVLVNNAATNPYLGYVINIDHARWNKIMQVNLTGPLIWSQAAWAKSMSTSTSQSVILNVSSVGGLWTSPEHGAYDVSKAALMHLTRQLAAELGPKARVNSLAPGLTRTDFNSSLFAVEGAEERLASNYPLGRLGRVEDMGAAALFLVSGASSWVTGQTLLVDGGGLTGFARTG